MASKMGIEVKQHAAYIIIIAVVADPDNETEETDETNNELTETVSMP